MKQLNVLINRRANNSLDFLDNQSYTHNDTNVNFKVDEFYTLNSKNIPRNTVVVEFSPKDYVFVETPRQFDIVYSSRMCKLKQYEVVCGMIKGGLIGVGVNALYPKTIYPPTYDNTYDIVYPDRFGLAVDHDEIKIDHIGRFISKKGYGAMSMGIGLVKFDLKSEGVTDHSLRYVLRYVDAVTDYSKSGLSEHVVDGVAVRLHLEVANSNTVINNPQSANGVELYQDYVENIEHEYRAIVGCDGSYYIGERVTLTVDGEFKVINTNDVRHIDYTSTIPKMSEQAAEMKHFARAVLNHLNLLWASFDFFVTKDGKWGCFEFSNEFGSKSFSDECFLEKFYLSNLVHRLEKDKHL